MIKIFLSGGMANMSYAEAEKWRTEIISKLPKGCNVFNPNQHYNFNKYNNWKPKHINEARDYNLHYLKQSDLVIVNFNDPTSIGTAQELAIAKEYNIPIMGICTSAVEHYNLHNWLRCCTDKMFYDVDEMIDYVVRFYVCPWIEVVE